MKNNYRTLLQVATLGAFAFAAAPAAHALATIRISDGTSVVTIGDETAGDLQPGIIGAVGANSVTFAGWTIVVTSGATKTLQGSATLPDQHLEVKVTGSGAATSISVLFSETGFGPTSGSFFVPYSATIASSGVNSVNYQATYDTGNALFGGGTLASLGGTNFASLPGFTTNGANSNNLTGSPGVLTGPYSISERITINMSATGVSRTTSASIDVTAIVPDGGSTVALLGFAFAGFGFLRRKLNAAA